MTEGQAPPVPQFRMDMQQAIQKVMKHFGRELDKFDEMRENAGICREIFLYILKSNDNDLFAEQQKVADLTGYIQKLEDFLSHSNVAQDFLKFKEEVAAEKNGKTVKAVPQNVAESASVGVIECTCDKTDATKPCLAHPK